MRYISLLLLVLFISCNSNDQPVKTADKPTVPVVQYPLRIKPYLYYLDGNATSLAFKLDSTKDSTHNFQSIAYIIEPDKKTYPKEILSRLIDTATFEIIGCNLERDNILGTCYFRDKNHVYSYCKNTLQSRGWLNVNTLMDPGTFRVFEGSLFAADSLHIYWEDMLVKDADVKTFRPLKGSVPFYGKDKKGYIDGRERMPPEKVKYLEIDKYYK